MDIRTTSRAVGAGCLIIGSLALAIPVTITEADQTAAQQMQTTAAHLGEVNLSNNLVLLQILIVPAMIYTARLARRGAPKLAFFGGGLSALAWLAGLMAFAGTGVVVYHAATAADQSAIAGVLDKAFNDPVIGILTLVFVLGHVVGMVLLGAALWRSHAVPVWAAVLFLLFPIVHLAAHIIGSVALDDGSAVLLVVAAMVCGVQLLRLPNAEWDLPTADAATVPTEVAVPAPVA
jgi:hypothetical protein